MRNFLHIVTAVLMLSACKTVYVPVKTVEKVTVRDTTYLRWTDTLVRVEKSRISDFSGLLDTLYLEVPLARSTAFVDTATATLRGTLEQSGSMPVKIVEREHIVYRDSVRDREVPVPVVEEKIVKVVPLFWRIFGAIGVASFVLAVLWALKKFKVL